MMQNGRAMDEAENSARAFRLAAISAESFEGFLAGVLV